MNKMKDRLEKLRRQRYGCGVLLISNMVIMAVLAALLLINWFLPLWVGRSLLPELAAAGGVKGVTAQVRRLGLTGTDLENVRLDLDGRRVLEVDSLRVDYSLPWWPFQRHFRISGVTVSGARIHASWQNGVFAIPGFYPAAPVKRPAAASETAAKKKTSGGPSPLRLESVTLHRCVLKLDTGKGVFDLPFSAALRCPGGDIGRIDAEWEIYGGEDLVSGRAKWDGGTGALALTLDGSFHPARFRTLIPGGDVLRLGGMAKFAVRLDGRLGGAGGPQLTGALSFPQLRISVAGWTLVNGSSAAPAALRFKLDGDRGEYELTDLGVAGMISPVVEKIKGTFAMPLGRLAVDGEAAVRLPAGPTAFPTVGLRQDIRLVKEYHLEWSAVEQSGRWRVKGGTADKTAIVADIGPGRLRIPQLSWRSRGEFGRHGGTGYDFNLQTELTALPALTWAMKGLEVAVRPLTFRCEAKRQGGEYSGGLKLTADELAVPALKLKTGKATLELPLLLMRQNAWQGGLRLDKINWSGNNLADLEMTVTQVDDGLDFNGLVRQQLLPGSVWPCRCRVNFKPYPGGTFELRIEPYRLPEAMSAGAYFPAGEGVALGGQVAAKLEYRFGAAGNGGTAELQLRDGTLTSRKIDLEVTGIDADLTLAALPSLRTPPLQSLRCRSWRVGKLLGSELVTEFQVAKSGTLLLENFSTDWCGGKVYTSSLRLAPGQRNWHANLYCEDIILSQLLNDLGIARAVGKGTIHGRIPLRFGADGIHLEPGFLYSVPGVTNTLRLSDMEKLLDGLPKGSPAHAQLDLAMEALKDYDYDWARLNFATSGENLRVEMKFDGHPNRPLPFEYKNVNGQDILIRVEGRGANFQGIRLDVNNSVPLNQLLRINQSIKNLTGGKRP